MYLHLVSKAKSGYPYLTLGAIRHLAFTNGDKLSIFNLVCNPIECAQLKLRIDQNRSQYVSMIKSAKNKGTIEKLWNRKMLDLEYVESDKPIYPESMDLALIKIRACNFDTIEALIELFNSVGIELEYINKDKDSVRVDELHPYCTKRLVRYFPSQIVKIPRAEYNRLRLVNKWYAIKSGNFYYKNKNCKI